jgi:hypothetical protein
VRDKRGMSMLLAFRASTMAYEKVTVREWTASHARCLFTGTLQPIYVFGSHTLPVGAV